jgi:PadR family transcriptional regulator
VVAEGTVYPVLNRLRASQLVDAEWVESDSGHPRKYYSLTAAGRRRTIAMAKQSAEFLKKMLGLIQPLLEEKRR